MKLISSLRAPLAGFALLVAGLAPAFAGGTLTPVNSGQPVAQIRAHDVSVTINNGFARTEVRQTFFNLAGTDLEAIYRFPVPENASLSEVTINNGESVMEGEVLPRVEAETVYAEAKANGSDAGLATKETYQHFEFRVFPLRAQSEAHLRFVYYQPLEIDTGMGRYVYPLEDGGTDEVAQSFWTTNTQVEGELRIAVDLKSAVPVDAIRVPGFEQTAKIEQLDAGHYRTELVRTGAKLDRDFVFYYRLSNTLPGRVEVIPYKAAADQPGTFMMVVTPGADLAPLAQGADYTFVLDCSGSMRGKLVSLTNGIGQALGKLTDQDRFRVIAFNNRARNLVDWTVATRPTVAGAMRTVGALQADGGTDLYAGISLALRDLDADRTQSVVLVTDGVANQGIVDPVKFHKLLSQYDLRLFSFLLGNGANWPLMRTISDATGGFYAGVSNGDDLVGQILLAKSKITHAAMHDAQFRFSGARVGDLVGDQPRKLFRGQQQVIFGHYEQAGRATVELHARITGEDKVYRTTFDFPAVDTDNPEIERLWAMAQIDDLELQASRGALPPTERDQAIESLGVAYQIVTDQTAMVVLSDDDYSRLGIDRNNRERTHRERAALAERAQQPAKSYWVDRPDPSAASPEAPAPKPAPHIATPSSGGGGGGALGWPEASGVALLLGAFAWRNRRQAGNKA